MRPLHTVRQPQRGMNWQRLRRYLWSTAALVCALRLFNAAVFADDPPDVMLELACIALGGWLASGVLARPIAALANAATHISDHQRTQNLNRG